MAAGKLIRAIVFVSGKIGIKKLAYAAGAQLGPGGGTWAESAADVGLQFIEEICKCFGGDGRELSAALPQPGALNPATQREIKEEIAAAAQATGEQMQNEMDAAIAEVAPNLPQEDRARLQTYATMLPKRIRRTMQRAEDPTGRTLPEAKQFRTAHDLAEVLPPMPRFRAGRKPVYNRELTRVLGVGAFGEVWEATKAGFSNRRVALKFCLTDDAALEHEARLAQRLDPHAAPGIVQLLEIHPRHAHPDCGDVPLCLEYEYVDGPDLAAWYLAQKISDDERPTFVAGVIAEIAEIVQAAHGHQNDRGKPEPIVHRDLKPANILVPRVSRSPRFKITDFGIGGILRAAEDANQATRQRTMNRFGSSYTLDALGSYTPGYGSPQQERGEAADPRDDVYALGVIWFRLCVCDFASKPGTDYADDLREIGVPDSHIALMGRCLAQREDKRPANAGALADAVRALQSGEHRPPAGANSEGTGGTPMLPNSAIIVPATPKVVVPAGPQIIEARFPMTEAEAREVQAAAAKALGVPVVETLHLGGGETLEMTLIPAGEFLMGGDQSPEEVARLGDSKAQYFKCEHPRHLVRITKPFRIGKVQVTQAQWQRVMGNNPSRFQRKAESPSVVQSIARAILGSSPANSVDFGKHPVEQVSWDDCQQFCQKLSRDLGRDFRLPTEAEWEYFCRCGAGTAFHFGDTISTKQANYNGNYTYGNGSKGEYRQKTTPVGSFPANAWGLHDMHGNVWEWCADWFGEYENGEAVDPEGPGSGSVRALRGGSWFNCPGVCRSACRYWGAPGSRDNNFGFRVASGTL